MSYKPAFTALAVIFLAVIVLIIAGIQQEARDFEQKCHQVGGEIYSPDTGSRYDTAMCIDQDGRVIKV